MCDFIYVQITNVFKETILMLRNVIFVTMEEEEDFLKKFNPVSCVRHKKKAIKAS